MAPVSCVSHLLHRVQVEGLVLQHALAHLDVSSELCGWIPDVNCASYRLHGVQVEGLVAEAFAFMDTDRNGYLTRQELVRPGASCQTHARTRVA
jgi:hypothetical protein